MTGLNRACRRIRRACTIGYHRRLSRVSAMISNAHAVLLGTLAVVTGCAGQPLRQVAVRESVPPTPVPETLQVQTPAYSTYPLATAFSRGGPPLTKAQKQWIRQILNSPSYRHVRAKLRFAPIPGFKTPIVVYVRSVVESADRGGRVIGERDNIYFDPFLRGLEVAPKMWPRTAGKTLPLPRSTAHSRRS